MAGKARGAVPGSGRPGSPVPGSAVPGFVVPLLVLAAITYGSFLLEPFLSPAVDPINGYASELSARDQPYNAVYSAGDAITGALTIIVAITALAALPRRPLTTAGWALLGLFGVSAIGDASFPLQCAPSQETWCALRERAGQVSFAHQFHAVTSTTTITLSVLAFAVLALAARREVGRAVGREVGRGGLVGGSRGGLVGGSRRGLAGENSHGQWPAMARWGLPLAAAVALSGFATLALMVAGRWLGLAQRIQITLVIAGLLVIAWSLRAQRRAALRTPAGETGPRDEEVRAGEY